MVAAITAKLGARKNQMCPSPASVKFSCGKTQVRLRLNSIRAKLQTYISSNVLPIYASTGPDLLRSPGNVALDRKCFSASKLSVPFVR